jgi:hypothetical protein
MMMGSDHNMMMALLFDAGETAVPGCSASLSQPPAAQHSGTASAAPPLECLAKRTRRDLAPGSWKQVRCGPLSLDVVFDA